jgi:hypothetical protein
LAVGLEKSTAYLLQASRIIVHDVLGTTRPSQGAVFLNASERAGERRIWISWSAHFGKSRILFTALKSPKLPHYENHSIAYHQEKTLRTTDYD